MKKSMRKLEQACEKYRVTRQAHEALYKTSSSDLKERFVEALGYCGMQILSAMDRADTIDSSGKLTTRMMSDNIAQEWRDAYFDLIELYQKVK